MESRDFPEGDARGYDVRKEVLVERADHLSSFISTDQKWGDSFHYHLCLDSSMFGIEKCVEMIEDAYKAMRPAS